MGDVEDVFVGAVASVVAVAAAAVALVVIVDVSVVRIGSGGTEFNDNLPLFAIVVTVDDVDETWEEQPGGTVAATITSAIYTILTSLLFEEVPSTARPCLSRSKAGEMSASPGKRLFLLAAAAAG